MLTIKVVCGQNTVLQVPFPSICEFYRHFPGMCQTIDKQRSSSIRSESTETLTIKLPDGDKRLYTIIQSIIQASAASSSYNENIRDWTAEDLYQVLLLAQFCGGVSLEKFRDQFQTFQEFGDRREVDKFMALRPEGVLT